MMTMRPPQQGHGCEGSASSTRLSSPASGCSAGTSSRRRALAMLSARAAGEQAVVADAVEARRQDVDQESADELGGSERHDLLAITTFGAIVLPSEGHAV